MSTPQINELDSCLSELDNILNSLLTTNFYYEYFITNGDYFESRIEGEVLSSKGQPMLDLLFDHMIIQLDKLLELHNQLSRCIVNVNHKNLMNTLQVHWKRIYDNKEKIILWRNKIVAHSGEQSKNYVPHYKIDPEYQKTIPEIISMARYAVTYIWAVLSNILTHYMEATDKKYEDMYNIKYVGTTTELLAKAILNEKKVFSAINKDLKKNGFKPVIFCGYEKWPMNRVSE